MATEGGRTAVGRLRCPGGSAVRRKRAGACPRRVVLVALVALVALVWDGPLLAHELDEQRELMVSIAPGQIDFLLAWNVPPGEDAARLRALTFPLQVGRLEASVRERMLAASLLPRMMRGVQVSMDGVVLQPEVERFHLRDHSGREATRGLQAMALLRVSVPGLVPEPPEAGGAAPAWSFRVERTLHADPVQLVVQVDPALGWTVTNTALPASPPLWGPVELEAGVGMPWTVTVE